MSKVAAKAFEKLLDKDYVDAEFVNTEHHLTGIILTYENEPDLERSINALMIKQGMARIDFSIPNNPLADEYFQDLEYEATDR